MAAWRAMKRRLLPLAVAFLSAISAAGARAEPPVIGTLRLVAPLAHCAFFAAGGEQEDPAEAIFATELVSDDLAAAERGYMRIDGLLRELVLEERKETEKGEERRYRTQGDDMVTVAITMIRGGSRKSAIGQVVLVLYDGTITASRDGAEQQVAFSGRCGIEPAS